MKRKIDHLKLVMRALQRNLVEEDFANNKVTQIVKDIHYTALYRGFALGVFVGALLYWIKYIL